MNNPILSASEEVARIIRLPRKKKEQYFRKQTARVMRSPRSDKLGFLYSCGKELGDTYTAKAIEVIYQIFTFASQRVGITDKKMIETDIDMNLAAYDHTHKWVKQGRFYYEVTPKFAQVLSKTTVDKIPCDQIKLPAKTLYIKVPKHLSNTQKYIGIEDMTSSERGRFLVFYSFINFEENTSILYLPLRDGYLSKLNDIKYNNDQTYPKHLVQYKETTDHNILKFCMSLCLYLTSVNPDRVLVSGYYPKRKVPRNDYIVGSFLEDQITVVDKEKSRLTAYDYKGKYQQPLHIRGGHLKRQVCGLGRQDRKIIFVNPYQAGTGNILDSKTKSIVTAYSKN